jgi:uncharacterized membrane protein
VSHPVSLARRSAVAALAALALLAAVLPAAAPAARVPTYQAGERATFGVSTQSANARMYGVYITISSSRRTDRYGGLKRTRIGTFARMVHKGRGRYQYTTPDYTFPGWFMVETGTYFWQTSITDCSVPGCKVLSRIRSFKVV